MEGDKLSEILEHYGPYQRRLFFLLSFPLILCGYQVVAVVITFSSPDHRCQIPGWSNDTYQVQGDFHQQKIDMVIPRITSDTVHRYSHCTVYSSRSNYTQLNVTGSYASGSMINGSEKNDTGSDVTVNCDRWVYDKSELEYTIVEQFDFVCEQKGARSHFNMVMFAGMFVGSFTTSITSDRYGRKRVYVISITVSVAVCIAMTWPGVPAMLFFWRGLCGFLGMAVFLSLYVLTLEMMGPSYRSFAGTTLMLMWLLGAFVVGAFSYLVTDWRWLQMLGSAPFALCLLYTRWIPESPRWLISKGRMTQAESVIRDVIKMNKLGQFDLEHFNLESFLKSDRPPLPSVPDVAVPRRDDSDTSSDTDRRFVDVDVVATDSGVDGARASVKEGDAGHGDDVTAIKPVEETFLTICKYPNLIARALIIFFNWCVVSIAYYGVTLNVTNLAGSVRNNLMISNAIELVGYCAAWFLLDRFGRMRFHCSAMLVAGLACLGTIFTHTFGGPALEYATTALGMVGKMGMSGAYASLYLITSELFPTSIRNFGLGITSNVSGLAGVVTPYIVDLALYAEDGLGAALPLIIFGALTTAAGVLSLWLPETLNTKLPDTIAEAAALNPKPWKRSQSRIIELNY